MARNVPRVRTTRKSWNRDFHVQWRPWGGTGPFVQEPHPLTVLKTDSVTYGANYPDWRLRLSRGDSATTTLTGVRYTSRLSELHMYVVGKGAAKGFGRVASGFSHLMAFPAPPLPLLDPVARQRAAQAFLRNYLRKKRTWHGGAFIAEFAETIRFLANPISSVYRHTMSYVGRVGSLKKVYKRDPVKYGKLLGSAWLAYAFGLAPLVDDVNDAYAAVQSLSEELGAVDTVRIIGTGNNVTLTSIQTGVTVPYANYCSQDITDFIEYGVRYLGVVRCKPPSPMLIADNFGVGFTDILPAVWEGVPWSWLIDYFTNVNEMLESVSLAFADFSWVNETIRNRAVRSYSSAKAFPPEPAYYTTEAFGGQGYTQSTVVKRVPTTVPYPSWQFRIPGLPRQYANVAALVLAIKGSKP